jgi:hypothetical protein
MTSGPGLTGPRSPNPGPEQAAPEGKPPYPDGAVPAVELHSSPPGESSPGITPAVVASRTAAAGGQDSSAAVVAGEGAAAAGVQDEREAAVAWLEEQARKGEAQASKSNVSYTAWWYWQGRP